MKKIAFALASVLALSACAVPVYTKPGLTQSQFEMDKADCQLKFAASPWATNPFMATQFGQTCMRSKGYVQTNDAAANQVKEYMADKVAVPAPGVDAESAFKACYMEHEVQAAVSCLNNQKVKIVPKDEYAKYVHEAFPDGVELSENGITPALKADRTTVRKLVWATLPVNEVKE